MTYQIEAYGTLVHADTLKFQNFSKILKKKTYKMSHLHYIAESHAAERPLPGEYQYIFRYPGLFTDHNIIYRGVQAKPHGGMGGRGFGLHSIFVNRIT